jgi:putative spermidine/putrescine transport system substrate-binding protein
MLEPARSRTLSRRSFLGVVAASGVAATTGGCGYLSGGSGGTTLHIQTWPEPYPSIINEYAVAKLREEHDDLDIQVSNEANSDLYPRLQTALNNPPPPVAGGQWNDSWAARGAEDGMWQPLDSGNLPNAAEVVPDLNPQHGVGVTFGITPFGIAYNPRFVDPPTSWTDLYDPRYRGKVALWDTFFDWLIMAARIEGGDERNLEPGLRAWEAAKDNIAMWAPSLPLLHEALDRGEVWLAADWASWSLSAKRSGKSVEFCLPEEGATQASTIFEVHAGVEDEVKARVEELFNFYLTEEFQREQLAQACYSPVIEGVTIPSELADPGLVTAAEAVEKLVRYDYAYIGSQFSAIDEQIRERLK